MSSMSVNEAIEELRTLQDSSDTSFRWEEASVSLEELIDNLIVAKRCFGGNKQVEVREIRRFRLKR